MSDSPAPRKVSPEIAAGGSHEPKAEHISFASIMENAVIKTSPAESSSSAGSKGSSAGYRLDDKLAASATAPRAGREINDIDFSIHDDLFRVKPGGESKIPLNTFNIHDDLYRVKPGTDTKPFPNPSDVHDDLYRVKPGIDRNLAKVAEYPINMDLTLKPNPFSTPDGVSLPWKMAEHPLDGSTITDKTTGKKYSYFMGLLQEDIDFKTLKPADGSSDKSNAPDKPPATPEEKIRQLEERVRELEGEQRKQEILNALRKIEQQVRERTSYYTLEQAVE